MVRLGGRGRLSAYLQSRLDDDLKVQLHMAVLDPFFAHANDGRYTLSDPEHLRQRRSDLEHAIRTASSRTYVSIDTVRIGYPGSFSLFLRSAWKKRLAKTLTTPRTIFQQEALRAWHGRDGYGEFIAAFEDAIWRDALATTFDYMPMEIRKIVQDVVLGILLSYLSYAVHDLPVGLKTLTPLVAVLPDAIPIGEPIEWPGTCLFLAA